MSEVEPFAGPQLTRRAQSRTRVQAYVRICQWRGNDRCVPEASSGCAAG